MPPAWSPPQACLSPIWTPPSTPGIEKTTRLNVTGKPVSSLAQDASQDDERSSGTQITNGPLTADRVQTEALSKSALPYHNGGAKSVPPSRDGHWPGATGTPVAGGPDAGSPPPGTSLSTMPGSLLRRQVTSAQGPRNPFPVNGRTQRAPSSDMTSRRIQTQGLSVNIDGELWLREPRLPRPSSAVVILNGTDPTRPSSRNTQRPKAWDNR